MIKEKLLKLKLSKEQINELKKELGVDLTELHLGIENVKVLKIRNTTMGDDTFITGPAN